MKAWITGALVALTAACAPKLVSPQAASKVQSADEKLLELERGYVIELLRRNPAMNTYLGGAGLHPSLQAVDGRLRDVSPAAIADEDRWLEATAAELEAFKGASAPALLIDREVALAQLRFLLHQHRVRRHQERALDTYVDEPFRSVDWQLQGMSPGPANRLGTPSEWELVASRLADTPRYLAAAREQLAAGARAGNTPDPRMLVRHGLNATAANTEHFSRAFPQLVDARIPGPEAEAVRQRVKAASLQAAGAYAQLRTFIVETFFDDPSKGVAGVKEQFRGDRYALGEAEYDWALRNNLRIATPSARLFEESRPVVQRTRQQMVTLAREIGARRELTLPADDDAAVRAVMDALAKDAPRSDAELLDGYQKAVARLVDYGRRTKLFDIPSNYRLEVVPTPPPLRASMSGAAYYPAPPFKQTGVGRFYVTPTGDDPVALGEENFHSMADLAAHEGFPGHDWQFKLMSEFTDTIGWVRWLTPGAVEDSSSMWEDSSLTEGWGLYAEALVAEARPGAPDGFYTPEERLYQLAGQLYRDLRVTLDIGLHTGRISYDDAVDLVSQTNDFLEGSCRDLGTDASPAKRESCRRAERAIFRYSSWPTQAITYRLGKEAILELRRDAEKVLGDRFSLQRFHLELMRQGTIPVAYFRAELLKNLGAGTPSRSP